MERALRQAGWTPGRRIDVTTWISMLEQAGYEMHDTALRVWAEFGNLRIRSSEGCDPPSNLMIDPADGCIDSVEECRTLSDNLSMRYFPLGMWSNQFRCYIGADSSVVAASVDTIWRLGPTFADALHYVVEGDETSSHEEIVTWLQPGPPRRKK
ncbi:SUKH-3 domain-containing protein [Kutzneria sp. CA-103260]|uniref:SUKH-3 domain-containing protein n=1 Tax=Kutzneria sp. CA-103260 TaxID=2802641 RepID=UPI001BADCD45|nr:SUKH-3 domain-containing protein [Kutzneria sp. CA-103260]